jgi:hypothetical protein
MLLLDAVNHARKLKNPEKIEIHQQVKRHALITMVNAERWLNNMDALKDSTLIRVYKH